MTDDVLQRQAISDLKMRYARFCDAGYDPDGIAGLFTEDGVWDGGALFGRAEGTAAIRAHFAGASTRIPWALHYCLCPLIEVAPDGTSATGSWYLWQPCQRRRGDRIEQAYLAGTYRDTYVRVGEGWRFREVIVEARWLDGPVTVPSQPARRPPEPG